MNLSIYKTAIAAIAVGKLTDFLKLPAVAEIVEIEGWSKMRAPEKRDQLLEAFGQVKQLREQFVVFYADQTGKDADFSEWEIAAADPADAPADDATPPDEATPAETSDDEPMQGTDDSQTELVTTPALNMTLPGPAIQHSTVFVEGAFEQIVSDVAGLDAQSSKASLLEAEDRMEFEHVRMGALLAHIRDSQHYITLGYDNMREFMATETGLDYRKGTYLIANYTAVKQLGISAEHLKGVTWSALRHVIPILTTKNYKKWLEAARSTTHVTLIEQVAKEKVKQAGALAPPDTGDAAPAAAPKPTIKTFNVFDDQNSNINSAIEKAKIAGNVDSNGAALDIIASAYVGAPTSDTTVGAVMPDLTQEGFTKMFSKMKADSGYDGLMSVLNAIDAIWDDVEINVQMPQEATAAE